MSPSRGRSRSHDEIQPFLLSDGDASEGNRRGQRELLAQDGIGELRIRAKVQHRHVHFTRRKGARFAPFDQSEISQTAQTAESLIGIAALGGALLVEFERTAADHVFAVLQWALEKRRLDELLLESRRRVVGPQAGLRAKKSGGLAQEIFPQLRARMIAVAIA